MKPIRTLIADDHPATCKGVAALLNTEPEITIVGTASDGLEAVEKALALDTQVVVMDIKMPELDGIRAAHRIKAERPAIGIVILSNYNDSSYLRELLSDGQLGYAYLLKTATIDEIKATVLTVAQGGLFIDPQVSQRAHASSKLDRLTARERDVLEAMAQGLDNRGVAGELGMQPGTVSMHVSSIYAKLQVDALPDKHARVAVALMWHGLLD
ncbi:MAG: response regulator transcription factor [Chloroflexi bacterium]|nr:response regulator transcription factor [Chloroflexota bacterium]